MRTFFIKYHDSTGYHYIVEHFKDGSENVLIHGIDGSNAATKIFLAILHAYDSGVGDCKDKLTLAIRSIR